MANEFNIPAPSTDPSSFTSDLSIIKVEKIDGQYITYKITWPAQAGSLGYDVCGSFNPFRNTTRLHAGHLPASTLTFTYQLPITLPTDAVLHFWVWNVTNLSVDPVVRNLIQDEAATLFNQYDPFATDNNPLSDGYGKCTIDNEYMRFMVVEMRNRSRTILENTGEAFELYWRRWGGNTCRCTTKSMGPSLVDGEDLDNTGDPNYDGVTRCIDCFGTGILAGFYPKQELMMRYQDMPLRQIRMKEMSLDFVHDFNTFTLWLPRIHEHDLVVRKSTGERFVVKDPKKMEFRGSTMHQEANLLHVQDGDIRQLVTNATISDADLKANQFDIARYGFSVFQ